MTTVPVDRIPAARRVEQIGDATLYLGDCLDVMREIADQSVDLLWTDPPYGHNNANGDLLSVLNAGKLDRAATPEGKGATPIANDDMENMRRVVDQMLTEASRVLRSDSCCCCCGGGGPRPTFAWLAERMDRDGLSFFHSTIWDKANPGLGWRYKRQHEMVMVAHRKGGKLAWASGAAPVGNVFRGWHPGAQRQHPNEKPLWLVKGFVERHTEPGQMVLDPFMGGGTTGVAAAQLGRRFIGVELDEKHFETALRRIAEAERAPEMLFAPSAEQAGMDI